MERLKEEGVISSTPEEHLLRQSKEQQLLQNKK
jgi:hypothetical protein